MKNVKRFLYYLTMGLVSLLLFSLPGGGFMFFAMVFALIPIVINAILLTVFHERMFNEKK